MAKTPKKSGDKAEGAKGGELQTAAGRRAVSPFDEMDRLFENFFPRGWMRPFRWEWPSWGDSQVPIEARAPKVDVVERDNEIVVKAEVPGVKKEDLDVSVTSNTVTIKGTTSHEEKEEKGDYYRCEISRGSFSRTVALPGEVDSDGAKASFKDGVLELTMPKVETAKRRSVKVE
ncbi:MAG: Hsp20/alpha crystallin family protein [Gammaproteobacteria bacterium]